jgi:hypothetical protein
MPLKSDIEEDETEAIVPKRLECYIDLKTAEWSCGWPK